MAYKIKIFDDTQETEVNEYLQNNYLILFLSFNVKVNVNVHI